MVAHRETCANLVNTLMKPVQTERNEKNYGSGAAIGLETGHFVRGQCDGGVVDGAGIGN